MRSERASYTLAYSPCPNDTYIFAALTNGMLPSTPEVAVHLADIDELNRCAAQGRFELTKVSYGAIPYLMDRYRILRAGGALGRGCGPLVVTRDGFADSLRGLDGKLVAIPGENTTAFMLLQLALGTRPQTVPMRFDRIVQAVAGGEVDAGLIVHESRFTYSNAGLVKLLDLGDWWESVSGMPIPLGAVLVKSTIGDSGADEINDAIRRSLAFSRANEPSIMPYVREHAYEMDDDVMRAHIALYVNEFSDDLGAAGIAAVHELFARARAAGILEKSAEAIFI
ncbi:MAG: 1,4-dihydroxy-6-naphthoate synthase [Candidatus Eremiobacteraeota bacterium]|nr:1,4-dihydroxy-6-naphthoate synthase [Candidatus Eremiobacteraeota bacterium]